jgi:taurine dioxygenase
VSRVLAVRQLGVALGAEIRGVDLSQPLDATAVDFFRSAFLEHIVLVIRGQSLVPEGRGDTMFCNMYAAYEQLSPGMQHLRENLQALHSGEATAKRNREAITDALPIAEMPPPIAHPAVRTHPETGRKALYVNLFFTQRFTDMDRSESAPIMNYIYELATRSENVYRHRWTSGDVLMWDNRCAMHYAIKDYDEHTPRLMHRTTAAGDRPY